MQERKVLHAAAESLSRVAAAKADVAAKTSMAPAVGKLKGLTDPKSPASTMRKAGAVLIAAPDPVTGVAGVALVASAFAMKKKEPAKLADLAAETRKILRDLQGLSL